MSFPYDGTTTTALTRLAAANSSAYNVVSNASGLGSGGHIVNFTLDLNALATVANSVSDAATAASTSATAAASSATAAAASAANFTGTSTTTFTPAVGSQALTVTAGKSWPVGTILNIASAANPTTNYGHGTVTAYSSTTLTVTFDKIGASPLSASDWNITLSGPKPADGANGSAGSTGATGAAGRMAGIPMVWQTANDNSDPGSAKLKINNATPSLATALYISETDSDGKGITSLIKSAALSSSAVRGRIDIFDATTPANFVSLSVTAALTDNGGWDTLTVAHLDHGGTLSNGTAVLVHPIATGDKGDTGNTGATGATGSTGATGPTTTNELNWDSATTDADPGDGTIRADNATYASITKLYVDDLDRNGGSIAAWVASWDDSTNSSNKGEIILKQISDPEVWLRVKVTGANVTASGYTKISVSHVGSNGTLSGALSVAFSRSGDKGSDGSGSGVYLGEGTPMAGHFVVFGTDPTTQLADGGTFSAITVPNTPAGNISSSNVQAAINELDTEKQPIDATLTALAGVTTASDKIIYATGSDAFTTADFTSAARSLLDDTSTSAMRTTLGLGTAAVAASTDFIAATALDTDTALSANSDTRVASQKAIKTYVDNVAAGLDAKPSVLCATTANITLSGEQTIDGVLTSTSRILVKDQSTASQNGIYVTASGSWTRATDMDAWTEVPGAYAWVEQGTANGDTGWVCSADTGGSIGSTSITFVQFAASSFSTASNGITKSGQDFRLNISGLTEDTSPDIANDFVATYDTSASGHKKVKPSNLGFAVKSNNLSDLSSIPTAVVNLNLSASIHRLFGGI